MNTQDVYDYLTGLQSRIIDHMQAVDGKPFRTDSWQRPEGGGGISRLVEEGNVLERGGVNFSHVLGAKLPPSASAHRPELAGRPWEAMGVSLVLHPRNPYAPTVHMNVRFFVAYPKGTSSADFRGASQDGNPSATQSYDGARRGADAVADADAARENQPIWWFGGGMDLTPYYGFDDDAAHFHRECQAALEPFGADYHPRFKAWCDEYFFLKHRGEPRGVGGVFFDDLGAQGEIGFDQAFALMRSVGDHFLTAYAPILERRKDRAYGERERDFQAYRRGRYVEFNLVFDRGTLFGLQSGGRTESILMSMPPIVKWRYDWTPEAGSPEAKLYERYLVPQDWAAMAG